jgi:hypothetical protein
MNTKVWKTKDQGQQEAAEMEVEDLFPIYEDMVLEQSCRQQKRAEARIAELAAIDLRAKS